MKVDTQKSVALLYTNNKQFEKKIKKSILFIIASKRIKHSGINLTKETKDLYTKNYKALLKEIKTQTNRKTVFVYRLEYLIL